MIRSIFSLLTVFLFCAHFAMAAEKIPKELQGIGINPILGEKLDLELKVFDESGVERKLAHYFDGEKPVVLLMAYYGCPMLCGLIINSVRQTVQDFDWKIGEKYKIVTLSIDPTENHKLARAAKESLLAKFPEDKRANVDKAWQFLTAPALTSQAVAKKLGFSYRYDEEEGQYAHSAAAFMMSGDAVLSRVLFGLNYKVQDFKLALLEAGRGKIGTIAEKILLFCYGYNPKENKYALLATRVMRAGGGLMVFVIVAFYFTLFARRRTRLSREG